MKIDRNNFFFAKKGYFSFSNHKGLVSKKVNFVFFFENLIFGNFFEIGHF